MCTVVLVGISQIHEGVARFQARLGPLQNDIENISLAALGDILKVIFPTSYVSSQPQLTISKTHHSHPMSTIPNSLRAARK